MARRGTSGTENMTGSANAANQSAENTATSRMFRPSSLEAPAQSTTGWMNTTRTITRATMPPTYPMAQPKPLTRPTVAGVEICVSMAL